MIKLSLTAAALLVSVAAVPAHAATFEFAGVKFGDGATVSGSFVTDATFTTVTSFNVVTAAGAATLLGRFPTTTAGTSYTSGTLDTAILSANGITFRDRVPGFSVPPLNIFLPPVVLSTLSLSFGTPLSASGSVITGGSEGNLLVRRSVAAGGRASFVAPPVVAAVPEPATWGMMILGFGAMGFAMRRRARVRTTVSFA